MNPLRLYVKNRLEHLERENCALRQQLCSADRMRKIGYCFQRIIKEADIQIEYDNDMKIYRVYSGRTGNTIYVFEADKEWDTTFISYLLEVLTIKRD